jgi:hypothetical protein
MNLYYAKTALYAYANIDAVVEQIDELVEKKALFSMNDLSPCEQIAEKILDYTAQKVTLIELKNFTEEALKSFSQDQLDCLDYKYFKRNPKEYYDGFDFSSRNYFRKQIRLAKKFSEKLERVGASDEWFKSDCLKVDFLRELLKRVYEHEKKSCKNKPKAKKETSVDKNQQIQRGKKERLTA